MKNIKSILLCFLMISLLFSSIAYSNIKDDNPIDFVEKYMEAKLNSMLQKDTNLLDVYFDDEDPESLKTKLFIKGLLDMWIYTWEIQGSDLTWFSSEFISEVIYEDTNSAHVNIQYIGNIKQKDTGDLLHNWMNETRDIFLTKTNKGNWIVQREDYIDEFIEYYGTKVNFDDLKSDISSFLKEQEDAQINMGDRPHYSLDIANIESENISPRGYVGYNRQGAASYALDYSSNNSGTSSYNDKFVDFSSDCQNFVSQCIWKGFGGVDAQYWINAHSAPMLDYNFSHVTDWWCDEYGTGNNWTWTSTSNFYNMITDNYSNNKTGVQGIEGSLGLLMVGDYIYCPTSGSRHVWFINNIIDHNGNGSTDWNEIYVCAHTTNRRDYRLSNTYPTKPSSFKLMWVETYKMIEYP